MTIGSAADLAGMRAVGRLVAETLRVMRAEVRPGVTTAALDARAERFARRAGARSAPQLTYDFPGFTYISVNEELVHGIPGPRMLRPGDAVKLDVTLELGGHGLGRRLHEEPSVPNYPAPSARMPLADGMVLAVEPILTLAPARVVEEADGWTLRTPDRSIAVHQEHTIVVRHGAPEVLTAA